MNNRPGGGPAAALDPWDGVLLVDKPSDYTSHDVVAKLRSRFRIKKVGHGGTLDPMATGLLVVLTGRGTRLSQQIMGGDKTYEGTMQLGVSTSTQDAEGDIIAERDAGHVTPEMIEKEMKKRVGDIMQTPPMVSAVKKNGVPLYKLARKGREIEREPRLIHIYRFVLKAVNGTSADFELKCTKGTYVRTLCHDIGEELGCGAHLSALRRTRSGSFSIEDAAPLDELTSLQPEELFRRIIPITALPQML